MKHNTILGFLSKFLIVFVICTLSGYGESTAEFVYTSNCFDNEDLFEYNSSEIEEILFKSKPILGSYWAYDPPVRLCPDSGVSVARLSSALDFWKRMGYDFGEIIIDEDGYNCAIGGSPGEITILLVTSDIPIRDKLAITRTHRFDNRVLLRSQIFINRYSADKPLVLEHEIGHAFGWSHFNSSYHIMNANYELCGHGTKGIKYSDYLREINRLSEKFKEE